jgi:hypothetical protein
MSAPPTGTGFASNSTGTARRIAPFGDLVAGGAGEVAVEDGDVGRDRLQA